ncbi:MAG: hypothetical protein K1X64_00185 [Myxococcaceae bacterium]|nr:hypothetical protein [Myxococcaceae bacterium]
MKRYLLCMSALTAIGCGNWSNKDLEFLNALPVSSDLTSKLPGAESSSQGLSSTGGQRRDPLMSGEASRLYADTKKASSDFNGILSSMLSTLEFVRNIPPTRRESDVRVWGPYPDSQHPGFDFQIVVSRVDAENFTWAMQSRKRGDNFFDAANGNFKANTGIRRGQGAFAIHLKEIRAHFPLPGIPTELEEIEVGYITDIFPLRVDMHFVFAQGKPTSLSEIGYVYFEKEDHSGAMHFQVRTSAPEARLVETSSVWATNGAGRASTQIVEGTFKGASEQQCWNEGFNVVWGKQTWLGGMEVGNSADCVVVSGF